MVTNVPIGNGLRISRKTSRDAPFGAEIVCLSGLTGSDRRTVRMARMTDTVEEVRYHR
jgi:hypothetical protein